MTRKHKYFLRKSCYKIFQRTKRSQKDGSTLKNQLIAASRCKVRLVFIPRVSRISHLIKAEELGWFTYYETYSETNSQQDSLKFVVPYFLYLKKTLFFQEPWPWITKEPDIFSQSQFFNNMPCVEITLMYNRLTLYNRILLTPIIIDHVFNKLAIYFGKSYPIM